MINLELKFHPYVKKMYVINIIFNWKKYKTYQMCYIVNHSIIYKNDHIIILMLFLIFFVCFL